MHSTYYIAITNGCLSRGLSRESSCTTALVIECMDFFNDLSSLLCLLVYAVYSHHQVYPYMLHNKNLQPLWSLMTGQG